MDSQCAIFHILLTFGVTYQVLKSQSLCAGPYLSHMDTADHEKTLFS